MKKCKSCGVPSRNKTYEGDTNSFNVEHCMPCAGILKMSQLFEEALNRPNPVTGWKRKVKLKVEIKK